MGHPRRSRWLAAITAVVLAGALAGPASAGPPPPIVWTRAAASAVFDGAYLRAVAGGPAGLVAVGSRLSDGSWQAGAWTSRDGRTWRRSPDLPGGSGTDLAGVARWRGWFYAAGTMYVQHGNRWTPGVALYRSRDGARWARLAIPSSLVGVTALDVVAMADRLGLVGCRDSESGGCWFGTHARAAIWTSRDGVRWTATAVAGAENAYVSSLARTPFGYTAVGGVVDVWEDEEGYTVSSPVEAALWVSRDGARWRRAGDGADLESASAADVASAAGRVVAVGAAWACVQSWTTTGGATWRTLEDGCALSGEFGAEMDAVAAIGRTFVATGFTYAESAEDPPPLPIWVSQDGRDWSQVGGGALRAPGGATGSDVIAWRGMFVVVGAVGIYEGETLLGAVWLGRPR